MLCLSDTASLPGFRQSETEVSFPTSTLLYSTVGVLPGRGVQVASQDRVSGHLSPEILNFDAESRFYPAASRGLATTIARQWQALSRLDNRLSDERSR